MSNLWITSAVKMKLVADSRTPATEIHVDTYDGVVTLFNMVPSKESKTAAHEIAHSVSGVKWIENQIEVVSSASKKAVEASDEEIQEGIKKTLKDRGDQENAGVDVEVKNGVARLTPKPQTLVIPQNEPRRTCEAKVQFLCQATFSRGEQPRC